MVSSGHTGAYKLADSRNQIRDKTDLITDTDRTQHEQKQDKDDKSQHQEPQPSHSMWENTGRNRVLPVSGHKISTEVGRDVEARIQKEMWRIQKEMWKLGSKKRCGGSKKQQLFPSL